MCVSTGPISSTSSSWTILIICWPGFSEASTSVPAAFSVTRWTKSRTTS